MPIDRATASRRRGLLALGLLALFAFAGCDRRVDVDFNYAFEQQDWKRAEQLLAEGADIDARFKGSDGYTTLMMAAREERNPQGINWLLEHGADPDVRTWNGRTALYIAAANGRPEHVKMLIAAGADVNARTDWGETPLTAARNEGCEACSVLLLDAGATR